MMTYKFPDLGIEIYGSDLGEIDKLWSYDSIRKKLGLIREDYSGLWRLPTYLEAAYFKSLAELNIGNFGAIPDYWCTHPNDTETFKTYYSFLSKKCYQVDISNNDGFRSGSCSIRPVRSIQS